MSVGAAGDGGTGLVVSLLAVNDSGNGCVPQGTVVETGGRGRAAERTCRIWRTV